MSQFINIIITIASAVYILFLPGFVLSFVFFRKGTIDIIERTALAFALSIAIVPLLAFYLNLLGVRLSRVNVLLEVLAVLAVSGLIIKFRPKPPTKVPPHKDISQPAEVRKKP